VDIVVYLTKLAANFVDYLPEAHHLFERARMLDDEASRTGLAFVTTELAVSRRFAEAALAAFSAGYWRAHLHNSRLHLSSTNS
jgi:hypothetical protein